MLILAALFVLGWMGTPIEESGEQGLVFLPFLFGALGTIFIGTVSALFFRKRTLFRPSLDRFLLTRNSPLQFFWFGGWMFSSLGLGQIVECGYIQSAGLTTIAYGIGLIFGSEIGVRIFSRRFHSVGT